MFMTNTTMRGNIKGILEWHQLLQIKITPSLNNLGNIRTLITQHFTRSTILLHFAVYNFALYNLLFQCCWGYLSLTPIHDEISQPCYYKILT